MKRKIKWKRWLIAAAVAVLVIAGALYTWYLNALSAVNERRQDVVFVVESGENMDSVLERLQEENLIKNSFLVSLHARISGLTQTWEGVFTLNDTMSADEILRRLNDADEAKTNQTLITFPEGSWAKDYAALIEENLGISAEELIAKYACPAFIMGDFNAGIDSACMNEVAKLGWTEAHDLCTGERDETKGHHFCAPDGFERGEPGVYHDALDHIILKNGSAVAIQSYKRLNDAWFDCVSDHYPLYVDIEI